MSVKSAPVQPRFRSSRLHNPNIVASDTADADTDSSASATASTSPQTTGDAWVTAALGPSANVLESNREQLKTMALAMERRGMPAEFILASLRATAGVLSDLHEEEKRAAALFEREHVRQFVEQNAVSSPVRNEPGQGRYLQRSERKREERERLQANALQLLREARQARARHEIKKTRNMLLKLDQREIRRVLGAEGDDLCRQINTWLRSTASMF